jgi:hypothetical protein
MLLLLMLQGEGAVIRHPASPPLGEMHGMHGLPDLRLHPRHFAELRMLREILLGKEMFILLLRLQVLKDEEITRNHIPT